MTNQTWQTIYDAVSHYCGHTGPVVAPHGCADCERIADNVHYYLFDRPTRLSVIDDERRLVYERYNARLGFDYQDGGRTIKVFVLPRDSS